LVGSHPDEKDVLALRRQRLSQHLVATSVKTKDWFQLD
jgi:hypothetical protein